jgi:hypothetical protein
MQAVMVLLVAMYAMFMIAALVCSKNINFSEEYYAGVFMCFLKLGWLQHFYTLQGCCWFLFLY